MKLRTAAAAAATLAVAAPVATPVVSSMASASMTPMSTKNIVQTAAGNPNFSTLVAAVKAAGLAGVLSSAKVTVFAPTARRRTPRPRHPVGPCACGYGSVAAGSPVGSAGG